MIEIETHPELATRGSFAHLPLGKAPRKNDPRTLRLAKYLTPVAAYPDHVDWTADVPTWPMYGNDSLGDCTIAAAGHMIQAWTAAVGRPLTPEEAAVIAAYWATGSGDTGRYELDVLNFWRTQGIADHKIVAYVALDPANIDHVRFAIATFGGVYVGVALPLTAQGQSEWSVVGDGQGGGSSPGSWGGHAIPYLAYDARTPGEQGGELVCLTWGAPLKLTDAFSAAYCDEAYAIVTQDWLDENGHSPTGIDIDALLADLHKVEQTETPAGITIGDDDSGAATAPLPVFPWEIALRNATYWMQAHEDGALTIKFAPAQTIPGRGDVPMPPAFEVAFSPEGWAAFKERVAADGALPPSTELKVPRSSLVLPGR